MTYATRLKHWAIAHLLPSQQWEVIDHFRSSSDAEGYAKILRQNKPYEQFKVIFDVTGDETGYSDALATDW